MGEPAPYVLAPGATRRPLGPFRVLLDPATTDTPTAVYEGALPQGGPPLHVHGFDEAILVLAGRLLIHVDGQEQEVGAGAFAWLPAGCTHTFANPDVEPVHAVGLGAGATVLELLADRGAAAAAAGGTLPQEELAAVYARHASTVVGPPLVTDGA